GMHPLLQTATDPILARPELAGEGVIAGDDNAVGVAHHRELQTVSPGGDQSAVGGSGDRQRRGRAGLRFNVHAQTNPLIMLGRRRRAFWMAWSAISSSRDSGSNRMRQAAVSRHAPSFTACSFSKPFPM